MASTRRVLLTRTSFNQGKKFTIVASEGNFMPNEIFRFIRRPLDPSQPTTVSDDFLGVCSPDELQTLIIGPPTASGVTFRLDTVTLLFDSQILADSAWDEIVAAADDLRLELDSFDVIKESITQWIGTAPP